MSHESTIRRLPLRTVVTPAGTRIPATVNTQTPLHPLPVAEAAFRHLNGGEVSALTLTLMMEAMRDSAAVVVSYVDTKGELDGPRLVAFFRHAHEGQPPDGVVLLHIAAGMEELSP